MLVMLFALSTQIIKASFIAKKIKEEQKQPETVTI